MHLEELTHRIRNDWEHLDVEKVEVANSRKALEGTKSSPDAPA